MSDTPETYGQPGMSAPDLNALQRSLDARLAPRPPRITRGQFLFGMAALGLDLVWKEKQAMDDGWPQTDTTLETLEDSYPAGTYDEVWVVLGGLAQAFNRDKAVALQQYGKVSPKTPIAYINYSYQGYEIAELTDLERQFTSKYRAHSVSMMTVSLGGPTGWMATPGVGVPINRWIHNCCPFGPNDATDSAKAEWLANHVPTALFHGALGKYVGDPAVDYIGNLDGEIREHGWRNIISNAFNAGDSMMRSSSPQLYENQVEHFVKEVDLPSITPRLEGIVIPNKTEAAYCEPEDTSSDTTVYVVLAGNKYSSWLKDNFKVSMQHIKIPKDGHAPMPGAIEAAAPWLRKTGAHGKAF